LTAMRCQWNGRWHCCGLSCNEAGCGSSEPSLSKKGSRVISPFLQAFERVVRSRQVSSPQSGNKCSSIRSSSIVPAMLQVQVLPPPVGFALLGSPYLARCAALFFLAAVSLRPPKALPVGRERPLLPLLFLHAHPFRARLLSHFTCPTSDLRPPEALPSGLSLLVTCLECLLTGQRRC